MNPGGDPSVRRILVIDDSDEERALTRRALEPAGFAVDDAPDGPTAIDSVQQTHPDLVLLDLMMPEMSGFEVLTELRRKSSVPIVVLSGRDSETERVLAFELGVDDYVVKPFLVRELPARIRSILRRAEPQPDPQDQLDFGRIVLRIAEREVLIDGLPRQLTAKEFDLFAKLASRPRRVFSYDELLTDVWRTSPEWQDRATVVEHARRLRRKIEDDPEHPRWIETVRRVGYRFEPGSSHGPGLSPGNAPF